jgi:threonine dehydrogenase-like Zn-dependent dehydrogenase
VVYAQGPIGLVRHDRRGLMGASLVIGVDGDERRLAMAKEDGRRRRARLPASRTWWPEVKRLTGGGADVTIEALGTQATFEMRCARCARRDAVEPGRVLGQARDALRRVRRPVSAITASSPRCVRAARSACGG